MHLCLFEDNQVPHLAPLIHTRGVYQVRTGALTNLLRNWEVFGRPSITLHVRAALASWVKSQTDMPVNELPHGQGILFVNGRVTLIPDDVLAALKSLTASGPDKEPGKVFVQNDDVIAAWLPQPEVDVLNTDFITFEEMQGLAREEVSGVKLISRLWHLIDGLQSCLQYDLDLLMCEDCEGAKPAMYDGVTMVNADDVHVAPGAMIFPGAIISAASGPVYIDRDARIMEGAIVKGPVYIGKQSEVKPRADVGCSVLGPVCKAGGEVKEVIMQAFSNKAHEGFLGHAFMGAWCNIGAGTNASNLRNDYGETTLYNEVLGAYEKTGRQFLGLFMADHSKLGISSMVNTATVFGVSCNLYGTGFMPRYLPAFSWGSPGTGFETYRLDKACESMERIMARRGKILSEMAAAQLKSIHSLHHNHGQIVA